MSETESDSNPCRLCGEVITASELETHLQENHAGEFEEIQINYGEEIANRALNGLQAYHCSLCGEVLTGDDGDSVSIQDGKQHLAEEHPDTDVTVAGAISDVPVGSVDDEGQLADTVAEDDAVIVDEEDGVDDTEVEQSDTTSEPQTATTSESRSKSDEGSSTSGSQTSQQTNARSGVGRRGKYSAFGVGGAGNKILDAMLMRRDTLRQKSSRLAKAWEGGLQTYLPLNTNDEEIVGGYYQKEDQDIRPEDIGSVCAIGNDPTGAGRDPEVGRKYMEIDIEGAPNSTIRNWPFQAEDIGRAQAVMFIHSVVKGTGTGATPLLAEYIRQDILNQKHDEIGNKPTMAISILPDENWVETNPESTPNMAAGIGMMANRVNVILPFDNTRLEAVADDINAEIQYPDTVENNAYQKENQPLVKFLEAFMLSSNSEMVDVEATSQLTRGGSDDGFDVPDSFRPAWRDYPLTSPDEARPGVIAAPLLAVSDARRNIDEAGLGILIESALNHGLLVDCEPETAWGGTFIFFGPEEPMQDVSQHIRSGVEREKMKEVLGTNELRINVNQAVVPEVDRVHMWGLLWNPHMPSLEEMFEKAKEVKEKQSYEGRFLRKHWDEITPAYDYLGRENRA